MNIGNLSALKYSLSIALLSVIGMTGQQLKTEVLDAYKSIDSLIDLELQKWL